MTFDDDDPRLLRLSRPAVHFAESFLLGNGSLGASLAGRTGSETIDLNLDTVWSGGPLAADRADRSSLVAPLREAIAQQRFADADVLARKLQSDAWTQSYQPLGRLTWRWGMDDTEPTGYRRELDLAAAEVRVRSGVDWLDAFVSGPDEVFVAESGLAFEGAVAAFESPHPAVEVREVNADGVRWLTATGRAPIRVLPNYVQEGEPVLYGDELTGPGRTAPAGMGWAVAVAVLPNPGGGSRLLAAAASGFRGFDVDPSIDLDAILAEAHSRVEAALHRTGASLRRRHRDDFGSFFSRFGLDLTASATPEATRAQRYFDLGRYLLISSSRPGTRAANLQGIWNVDVRPAWSSNFTSNVNVEMNYWGAEVAGLSDLHEPLFDLAHALVHTGRVTARRTYGASGSVVHHNTDVWGFSDPVRGEPMWSNWSTGLAWIAAHIGDHLDFQFSEDFARDTAVPIVAAAAAFLLDQLVEGPGGQLLVSPSSSPEHRFVASDGAWAVTAGASLDQELAHQTFTRLVGLVATLGIDESSDAGALAARATEAVAELWLPTVDDTGRLREWRGDFADSEPDHRHVSHLYGVYPGSRVTEMRAPEHFDAARTSLRARLDAGGGYTGWSQAWVLALAARLRDRDLADVALTRLTGDLGSASLLDLHPHPGWPGGVIFQIDGNLGAVGGVIELLVQSHDGALSLLPALPSDWDAGTIHGARCRGQAVVDLEWADRVIRRATVATAHSGVTIIETANDMRPRVVDEKGRSVEVSVVDQAPRARTRWSWSSASAGRFEVDFSSDGVGGSSCRPR